MKMNPPLTQADFETISSIWRYCDKCTNPATRRSEDKIVPNGDCMEHMYLCDECFDQLKIGNS